ncbi:MAG TPA: copper homeostasis protein CutC [Candidatus Aquilonibacter sp.]|nr:copper homeostasis protein CutC [Candidatus Aquilonibacter sp.]
MRHPVSIEVCVDSVASAIAAERGGANRIELCSNLLEGGTTPSAGKMEVVRSRLKVGVQVMIRPRGGDFCYTEEEFEIMRRDLLAAKKTGADGVVLGILKRNGEVDVARTRELVELARPLKVTFHRAFDCSPDLMRALKDVICAGADRILTSGGKQTAVEAVPLIAKLLESAQERITIMACGSITAANVSMIIQETGVREIHIGLRRRIADAPETAVPSISLGPNADSEFPRFQVIEDDVRALRSAVDAA